MQRFLAFLVIIFLFSCSQKQQENYINRYQPKVVEAKGYVLPKDSMAEGKMFRAYESKLNIQPLSNHKITECQ